MILVFEVIAFREEIIHVLLTYALTFTEENKKQWVTLILTIW